MEVEGRGGELNKRGKPTEGRGEGVSQPGEWEERFPI